MVELDDLRSIDEILWYASASDEASLIHVDDFWDEGLKSRG